MTKLRSLNRLQVMEADTISKHGRNPKSQTSRSNLLMPEKERAKNRNLINLLKTFMLCGLIALCCISASGQQIPGVTLRNFAIMLEIKNWTRGSDHPSIDPYPNNYDVIGPSVFSTIPGVKKIVARRYNASISFGEVVKGQLTEIVSYAFDEQGRVTAIDNRRIRYQGNEIIDVTDYRNDGSIFKKYQIPNSASNLTINESRYSTYNKVSETKFQKTDSNDGVKTFSVSDNNTLFCYDYDRLRSQTFYHFYRFDTGILYLSSRLTKYPSDKTNSPLTFRYKITRNSDNLISQLICFRGVIADEKPEFIIEFTYER
ncbi:MAG: hypothetical protein FWH18_08090 [Marinilabiliaceae bacterium]|nr:hypothetical protein [Marinilabiliaceae bacterium]